LETVKHLTREFYVIIEYSIKTEEPNHKLRTGAQFAELRQRKATPRIEFFNIFPVFNFQGPAPFSNRVAITLKRILIVMATGALGWLI
jgi:hypothetical protein